MRAEILQALIEARGDRQPLIRATHLGTGDDRLIRPGAEGEPAEIAGAVADAFRNDRSRAIETAEGPLFLEVHNPALRFVIVGAVHIAQALAPIARLTGYDVHVIDPRGAFASAHRFPGDKVSADWPEDVLAKDPPDARTAFAALTHDPKIDDPALDIALKSECFYIGALGSKKTGAARMDRLRERGFTDDQLSRIHGPIGLPIGARSPAEIAIAIMAEVVNTLRAGKAAP